MNAKIRRALENDRLVDITSTGRYSGMPHHMEIWFHYVDGELYLSGKPGRRDWYANMRAKPEITFHLKQSLQMDIPAQAEAITDEAARRQILARILQRTPYLDELEAWIDGSPLVHITLDSAVAD
jgi:hypothetical protein